MPGWHRPPAELVTPLVVWRRQPHAPTKEPKYTGTAGRGLHAAAPERRLTRPPLLAVPTTSLGTSVVSRPLYDAAMASGSGETRSLP
jgi:hypothetical protein